MRAIRILSALFLVLGATVATAADWAPLADEWASFTLAKQETIRYGVDTRWNEHTLQAGTYACHYGNFGDPAPGNFGKKCQILVVEATPPVVTLIPFVACLPEMRADVWNVLYRTGSAPFSDTPQYVVWKGKPSCGGQVQAQLYSIEELKQFVLNQFKTDAELNAWTAAQPVTPYTAEQIAFMESVKVAYAAELTPETVPPPAPAITWWVQPNTSGTRPYYKPNSAGTGTSTKLGDVATKTACDKSKRLGTTNYYWVPSVSGYAICNAP